MEKRIDKFIWVLIFICLPFLINWDFHWFEPAAKKNNKGIKAYNKKDFKEALQLFLEAKGMKTDDKLISNTASTLYQLQDFKKALNEYSKIDLAKTNLPPSDFYYNLGNVFFKIKDYNKALEAYKKSLLLNNEDINVKKNYELTLQKIKDQKKKKNKNKDEKKKEQKKKQEQPQEEKHKNLMKYLNQNEKKNLMKKKRKVKVAVGRKKDW